MMPSIKTKAKEAVTYSKQFSMVRLLVFIKGALQSRFYPSLNIVGWDIIHGGVEYGIEKYGLAVTDMHVADMHTDQDYCFYHTYLKQAIFDKSDNCCQGDGHFKKISEHSSLLPESKRISKNKNVGRYQCNYGNCNKTYTAKHSLEIHQAHKHQAKNYVDTKFPCEYCDKTCQCKASLKVHQAHEHGVDNGVITKFNCEYEGCGKAYKYKATLKQHMMDKHNT